MSVARIRILDFDGSVRQQTQLFADYSPEVVDLSALGPAARLWGDARSRAAIRDGLRWQSRTLPTFLGSGDYHYVTAVLLEQFTEALTVVSFDHHPDWDVLPPRYGCGAWVSRAVEQENITQVVLVGMASDDLSFPATVTANLRAVKAGKIVPVPFDARRPWRWPRSVDWPLLGEDPPGVFQRIVDRIPTGQVYVTIDKDCLQKAYALTNWEEGRLGLDALIAMIARLDEKREIVGLDITGEYSTPKFAGRWKTWCSRIDHPRVPSARGHSAEEILAVNRRTNLRLLEAIRSFRFSSANLKDR